MRFFVDRAPPRVIAPRCGSARSSVACGRNRSASITGGIFVFFDRRASIRCIISRAIRCVFSSPVAAEGCVRTPATAPASAFTSRSRSGGTAFAFASDAPTAARSSADPRLDGVARDRTIPGDSPRGDGSAEASGVPSRLPSVTPAPAAMSAANARPPADGPPVAASRRAAPLARASDMR